MIAIVEEDIYRKGELWAKKGHYDVIRQFDRTRYLVRLTKDTITLINESQLKIRQEWPSGRH